MSRIRRHVQLSVSSAGSSRGQVAPMLIPLAVVLLAVPLLSSTNATPSAPHLVVGWTAVGTAPRLQERLRLEPVLTDPARLTRDWILDGSGDWTIGDGLLALVKAGTPTGPIHRPSAVAVLNTPSFGDVTFEVDVRSTAPLPDETPRRDVLLIVGYQSPTRFYYAHISSVRDDVHNGIFLVHDADRRRIDSASAIAPLTDRDWHRARLVRSAASGGIAVYFGDRTEPIMTASDRTLDVGRVGVGSFDDTAEFRRVRVAGVTVG